MSHLQSPQKWPLFMIWYYSEEAYQKKFLNEFLAKKLEIITTN